MVLSLPWRVKHARIGKNGGDIAQCMLKAVKFDIDGMYENTLPLCAEDHRRFVGGLTGKLPAATEVEACFGVEDQSVSGQLICESPKNLNLPIRRFTEIYEEIHTEYALRLFTGDNELLKRLFWAGLQLAIVMGKKLYSPLPTSYQCRLNRCFEMYLHGDPYCNVKARRLREFMRWTGLAVHKILYAGDMPMDTEHAALSKHQMLPSASPFVVLCARMSMSGNSSN